mgnify:CR=1 FL=1
MYLTDIKAQLIRAVELIEEYEQSGHSIDRDVALDIIRRAYEDLKFCGDEQLLVNDAVPPILPTPTVDEPEVEVELIFNEEDEETENEELKTENEEIAEPNKEVAEPNEEIVESNEEVAEAVGVGSVIFYYLYNDRIKDINFVMEDALSFDGNTGPYAQYTYARTCGILEKALNFDA